MICRISSTLSSKESCRHLQQIRLVKTLESGNAKVLIKDIRHCRVAFPVSHEPFQVLSPLPRQHKPVPVKPHGVQINHPEPVLRINDKIRRLHVPMADAQPAECFPYPPELKRNLC
jgi:hypothetical protein